MSNFILVSQHDRTNGGYPIRLNAEKIVLMETVTDPAGTMIFTERNAIRVIEDINTILFRITQGEKQ